MSMYNAIFGTNPFADLLLSAVGLDRSAVGRFRDCYIEDGMIAVYTRNGGGNRDCWCLSMGASHEGNTVTKVVEDMCSLEVAQEKGYEIVGRYPNPKLVKARFPREECASPESAQCDCCGCFMTYRVHTLPFYSHDRDDDFDSTYATIYFKPPQEIMDALSAFPASDLSGDEKWDAFFDGLRANDHTDPNVKAAFERIAPMVERITGAFQASAPTPNHDEGTRPGASRNEVEHQQKPVESKQ